MMWLFIFRESIVTTTNKALRRYKFYDIVARLNPADI